MQAMLRSCATVLQTLPDQLQARVDEGSDKGKHFGRAQPRLGWITLRSSLPTSRFSSISVSVTMRRQAFQALLQGRRAAALIRGDDAEAAQALTSSSSRQARGSGFGGFVARHRRPLLKRTLR